MSIDYSEPLACCNSNLNASSCARPTGIASRYEPPTGQSNAPTTTQRRGYNIATVALANKLARVAWRVWREQRPFEHRRPR